MNDNESKKWKILDSRYLMKRPWLTVRHDKVQLPDGRINPEFYVLEYPDWINVIAITKEGKWVMERQYRHGMGDISIEICAGVIEPGETPEQGARRELEEETGYGGGEWKLISVISGNPSTTNNFTHCFLATGVEPVSERHLDATEDLEVMLMDESEVLDLLLADRIKQALMAAPMWKYFALKSGIKKNQEGL